MDFIAGLLELIAKWIVGRKNRWGWVLHFLSGILWTFLAFRLRVYGLLVITLPAMVINIWNFIKWSRK